ncbi:hypothetical protein [Neptuniibacter sp. CAU 1671]|uniref:hypothetical protein n=1 Tax=Neptuniibacter sp. CAU 1671 TaxID=3032593 RepID=UPI0023DAED21|nr:hypothetical protein [Neptuniibacter sp. CAU 1671]MDF2182750.1 hypothetical protein [Neptuniibacter sp. CAU 1671]
MASLLAAEDKFDIQQNYRRYLRVKEAQEGAREVYNSAKASRTWVVGLILLLFALASDFFLGAAAGLFGVYFYGVVTGWLKLNSIEESLEELDHWFSSKNLRFEGRVLYRKQDQLLENPVDPFSEDSYSEAE